MVVLKKVFEDNASRFSWIVSNTQSIYKKKLSKKHLWNMLEMEGLTFFIKTHYIFF